MTVKTAVTVADYVVQVRRLLLCTPDRWAQALPWGARNETVTRTDTVGYSRGGMRLACRTSAGLPEGLAYEVSSCLEWAVRWGNTAVARPAEARLAAMNDSGDRICATPVESLTFAQRSLHARQAVLVCMSVNRGTEPSRTQVRRHPKAPTERAAPHRGRPAAG